MNRNILLSAIAALGALGFASASIGHESRAPQTDPVAVTRYIDRLAVELPSPREVAEQNKVKLSKEQAQRIGRMEPIIGAALTSLK